MNMTSIRRWHSYLGLFIAPSVLFFALTGAAQIYSLHEAHGSYRPPAILEKLSSVHKDQEFGLGHHHDTPQSQAVSRRPAEARAHTAADDDDSPKPATLALKAYFLLVALALVASTAFGLWMGLKQTRPRRLAWTLVLAGTVIPAVLTLF